MSYGYKNKEIEEKNMCVWWKVLGYTLLTVFIYIWILCMNMYIHINEFIKFIYMNFHIFLISYI